MCVDADACVCAHSLLCMQPHSHRIDIIVAEEERFGLQLPTATPLDAAIMRGKLRLLGAAKRRNVHLCALTLQALDHIVRPHFALHAEVLPDGGASELIGALAELAVHELAEANACADVGEEDTDALFAGGDGDDAYL